MIEQCLSCAMPWVQFSAPTKVIYKGAGEVSIWAKNGFLGNFRGMTMHLLLLSACFNHCIAFRIGGAIAEVTGRASKGGNFPFTGGGRMSSVGKPEGQRGTKSISLSFNPCLAAPPPREPTLISRGGHIKDHKKVPPQIQLTGPRFQAVLR